MRIISDIHGDLGYYQKVISECSASIQLGDFGFRQEHLWAKENLAGTEHRILFGNHDDYNFLYEDYSLGDYKLLQHNDLKILCVRGAYSIDKQYRNWGIDWFPEEELPIGTKVESILGVCNDPDVIISHDGPQSIIWDWFGYNDQTRTRILLDELLLRTRPKHWIFGHHHVLRTKTLNSCQFICLPDKSYLDF